MKHSQNTALVNDAYDVEQLRAVDAMLMYWRGEREVSRWERAVFFALRSTSRDDELSEADKVFLDFLADEAVRSVATELAEQKPSCRT